MLSRANVWPLGSQQKGRQEGKELPWGRAQRNDAIAAIHQSGGDGKAAKRLHQRARAVGYPRHLVGVTLDARDVLVDACAHGPFEREGFYSADALQRSCIVSRMLGGAR